MQINLRNSYSPSTLVNPDVAVFFDIFRASTTLLSLVHVGAAKILSANDEATCRQYHSQNYELISEVFRGGIDNSPAQVLAGNYAGRNVIHKSTNLTAAIFANRSCGKALIGGFVNAARLVAYLKSSGAQTVELIAASHFLRSTEAVEDLACAELYLAMLTDKHHGEIPRHAEIREKIQKKAQRQPPWPPHYLQDLAIATELDRFPYLAEALPLNERLMEIKIL